MSNKKSDSTGKRPYTQRARAERRDEIHRRITIATVHLHGTVGPARTTVSDIAKRAGVRRATVYNHFATDLELIDACSSHWFSENPPPNPAVWAEIGDPSRRVVAALKAMYEYYHSGREMLNNVLRDTELVPALKEIIQLKWSPMLEGIVGLLAEGSNSPEIESLTTDSRELELRASLRVALDFFTWQKLSESGLSNKKAAKLAAMWVEASRTSPL